VILLQVDPTSGDEPKTICEGCYETEDTYIFAWSSVPDVGHYRWLHGPIRRLLPNSKVDYLVRTIRCILDFFAVMNYHYGLAQGLTCTCNSLLSLFII
jgi:hypothetical protein